VISPCDSRGHRLLGAGQFDGRNNSIVLRPNGQIVDAAGYRNLIVKQDAKGGKVYLRDVAKVIDGVQDERMSRHFYARGFNPPASVVVFAVFRQAGANAVAVARSVQALIPQLQKELPGSIRLLPTFDRSQSIVNSLNDVKETLFIAFVLVIFVIFVFLGRASDTLIPMVALPMSVLITFVGMWTLGYSVKQSHPDGPDPRHRLPRRRRDRFSGKRGPPRRSR
jgi:multidrug efflux pump subunit AcrB